MHISLPLICTPIFMLIISGSSVGIYYSSRSQSDPKFQKCQWVGNYIEKGCIHHQVFYLERDQINMSTAIRENTCQVVNPYQEETIYWCRIYTDDPQSIGKIEEKEQYALASWTWLAMSIVALTMSVMTILSIWTIYFINSYENPTPSSTPNKTVNYRRSSAKTPSKTREMPVW